MFINNKKHKEDSVLQKLTKGVTVFCQLIYVLACIILFTSSSAYAETIITNTATASFSINGTSTTQSSSIDLTKGSVITPTDQLKLQKQSNKTVAKVGDIITYTLSINNPNNKNLTNVSIQDLLPSGLIYQKNSVIVTKSTGTTTLSSNHVVLTGSQLNIVLGTLPANNTWKVRYKTKVATNATAGTAINKASAQSDTAQSTTVQAAVSISNKRTPSTITFLKIDHTGTDSVIPPTSYNNGQSGAKGWQDVTTIKLADGSIIDLPTPQPLVEADQYEISEPIVIQVKDLDQNTDSTKIDTIFITIEIPGTNDKEILLLRETSPNSGIFRGVIATTNGKTEKQNGQLSLKPGSKITVNYRDEADSTDTSATAAFVVTNSKLGLSKTADKTTASIGEQVRYTLNFSNSSDANLNRLKIKDRLPLGIRYISGSAKLNNVVIAKSKVTNNGRSLRFDLSNMPRGDEWEIEYLTKITADIPYGKATNEARLSSGNLRSNIARASLIIKDDLMRSKTILTGRVYVGCETKKKPTLLKDARIFLETGRNILSDNKGFWHMEGVEAGTHVLQLDTDSLPEGYEPLLCGDNTRVGNDPKSRFVNLQAGSLWQVDFYVKKTDPTAKVSEKEVVFESIVSVEVATDAVDSKSNDLEINNIEKTKTRIKKPFEYFGKSYIESAPEGFDILWPKNNYVPEIASTKILVKSSLQHRVEIQLNGKTISALNYEGSDSNNARTIIVRRWTGVDLDIKNRNNTLVAILKNKSGKELARKTRNIHFSGAIASAEYLAEKSVLIADGKTTPTIAVLIKDEDGFPVRANTQGYYTLKDNRYQAKTRSEEKSDINLNGESDGRYKFHIEEDGIAYITLNPTSLSGELNLSLELSEGHKKEISAWLTPKLRDWVLVGIAEGTLAHKTLSGNIQALKDLGQSEGYSKQGRLAFFTKGRVKGKYLLTAAYDSRKTKQDMSKLEDHSNNNIDPDAWYNIYADNSHSQYDAASSSKLYIKLERDNFYALFGDYRTNLSVTKLATYERTLNGLKSEFNGKRFSYNAFVSETSNQHHHQEIQGDGTSGLYHLSHDIVVNSETIKLETRDRFHSEKIVETRSLSRYQDYDIDYDAGTLFFKFPITGRDRGFNPQFIVIDYDSESDNNKSIVAGGRVAVKTSNNKLEVGLSAINIGKNKVKDDTLIAIDTTYKITANTKIHAEIAQSKSILNEYQKSNAQIIELEKEIADLEAKIYYRKQDKGFGLGSEGSTNASQVGTKKVGAEVNYKINHKTRVKAEVSQQENLNGTGDNNKRQLAEVTVKHRYKQLEVNGGLRHSKEHLNSKSVSSNTVLAGAQYTTKTGKVTYRAAIEQNIKSNSIEERSPNRKTVGVDIKVKSGMSIFAEHELTDNNKVKTQSSRVGVTQSLWKGAKAKSTYTHERTAQAQRDYATLGLSQRIHVSKKLSADISIDHAKTIKGTQNRFNENEAVPQGSLRDDYTAFSIGMGSHIKNWSWTSRFELRDGDLTDKTNLAISLIHRLKNGREVSAKASYIESDESNGSNEKSTILSLGTAWHPSDRDFVFFSRLDLVDNQSNKISDNETTDTHTQKVIHNLHYNRKVNDETQISIHHGIKHIIDQNQQDKLTSTVDTGNIEIRRDIGTRWDIGVRAGYLHDWNADTTKKLAGISIGMRPTKNIWLEQGYNFEGFNDNDFDDNNYKHKGPYLSFRYKFNQDSFRRDLTTRRRNTNN